MKASTSYILVTIFSILGLIFSVMSFSLSLFHGVILIIDAYIYYDRIEYTNNSPITLYFLDAKELVPFYDAITYLYSVEILSCVLFSIVTIYCIISYICNKNGQQRKLMMIGNGICIAISFVSLILTQIGIWWTISDLPDQINILGINLTQGNITFPFVLVIISSFISLVNSIILFLSTSRERRGSSLEVLITNI